MLAAYKGCLLKLADLDPNLFERLSYKSTKARRIIARSPTDLYIKTPDLTEKFAKRLTSSWWIDTNLSQLQCKQRLQTACEVIDIQFGKDLVLFFPD